MVNTEYVLAANKKIGRLRADGRQMFKVAAENRRAELYEEHSQESYRIASP